MAKQKVIITIAHHLSILLPDDTGVATIVKALSKGLIGYHFEHTDRFEVTAVAKPSMQYPGAKLTVKMSEHAREKDADEVSAALAPKPLRGRVVPQLLG